MTDNQSVELDEILTNLVSDWQDWLHNGKPGEGAELIKQSKAQLNQLLIKERIKVWQEIQPPEQYEEYAKLMGQEACNICGFNAVKFREYIQERIAHLQSQLNKEGI